MRNFVAVFSRHRDNCRGNAISNYVAYAKAFYNKFSAILVNVITLFTLVPLETS